MLNLKAPAKINLVLEVIGRRRDGYHEICSILRTVDLCDRLVFDHCDGFSFECSDPSLETPDNLVLKAAHRLRVLTDYEGGASIRLEKAIPSGAGLGGGSSDAAATIRALNHLWKRRLSKTQLLETAALVGSDVPFFIRGGLAMTGGRGERVKVLPDTAPSWYVVSIPPVARFPDKTRRLYMRLTPQNFSDGRRCAAASRLIRSGQSIGDEYLFNAFEAVAFEAFPGLADYWKRFEEVARRRVNLCGSGPAMYAVMDSPEAARKAADRLRREGLGSYAVGSRPGLSRTITDIDEGAS